MNLKALTQICIEDRYSRRNIRSRILREIESDDLLSLRFLMAADSIKKWIHSPSRYDRMGELKDALSNAPISRKDLVLEIIITVLTNSSRVPVQTVAGIVAPQLELDTFTGVRIVSEVIGLLAEEDLFDVYMAGDTEEGSMMIVSQLELDDELKQFIAGTKYLPPMIVPPKIVTSNIAEQYYSIKDSLVLGGRINHHNMKLSLDVINILNQQALSLDTEIAEMPEVPNKELDTVEKQQQFNRMCMASKEVYRELIEHGNEFYFTHKYDKRGRVYSQGYHVNIQSTEYKKALINLKNPVQF